MVSPGGDPVVWVFPSPAWEGGEPPVRGGALFLAPGHAVVVGHTQATSCLTRRRSVEQGVSHRSGRIPSFPIRIEWGKGEGFSPQSFALLQLLHLLLK